MRDEVEVAVAGAGRHTSVELVREELRAEELEGCFDATGSAPPAQQSRETTVEAAPTGVAVRPGRRTDQSRDERSPTSAESARIENGSKVIASTMAIDHASG